MVPVQVAVWALMAILAVQSVMKTRGYLLVLLMGLTFAAFSFQAVVDPTRSMISFTTAAYAEIPLASGAKSYPEIS